MPDIGAIWSGFVNSAIVQLGVRFIGLYLFVLYIAQIFWTYRDAQNRTENRILPVLAALLVTVIPVLGLFIYLIVRSRETLGEAYERQLAEESLLAEAEQRVVCPTCHERVNEDFILCPTCRTRLKRVCPNCAKLRTRVREYSRVMPIACMPSTQPLTTPSPAIPSGRPRCVKKSAASRRQTNSSSAREATRRRTSCITLR
jgi:hypothetical protein